MVRFEYNSSHFSRLDGELRKPSQISRDMHLPPESDTESIADYADGTDAGRVQLRVHEGGGGFSHFKSSFNNSQSMECIVEYFYNNLKVSIKNNM